MTNRKDKQLQAFKELINKEWQLSIDEDEILENILEIFRTRDLKKQEQLSYIPFDDVKELLETLDDYDIKSFAETYLNMIEERDCEEKTLEDFDDNEIKEEYFDRFDVAGSLDIISDMHLEEMTILFLSFSPQKQQDIINLLKNDKI